MPNRKFVVPINVVQLASDPASPSEGDLWYNTTERHFKVRRNSATEVLAFMSDVVPATDGMPGEPGPQGEPGMDGLGGGDTTSSGDGATDFIVFMGT